MTGSTYILGISAFYHDSASCLIRNGEIIAAAQEERFSRIKHDASFPTQAALYCLDEAGIDVQKLTYVAFYDKPLLKFERLLETYLSFAPKGLRSFWRAMPLWLKKKLWIPNLIAKELGYDGPILFPEHHESHAASAFFPSPFAEAAIMTMDGVGEWTTTSIGEGVGNSIKLLKEIHFPHSLGLLYSAFTYYCGFRVNSGEYKLMGLAPYGEPKYVPLIYEYLIDVKSDGSFQLNMDYFNYCVGFTMTNQKFNDLFGGSPRKPESVLTQRHMDLAASIQKVTEEVVIKCIYHLWEETGRKKLCLAGGVALNCVSNGKIIREGPFEDIWIQPAAGDAGGALGAALAVWHMYLQQPRVESDSSADMQKGSYLGPSYLDEDIFHFLNKYGIPHLKLETPERTGAELIAEGKVLGWFQGRMEFGPRALGNRSILGDPRREDMQSIINLKIKYRESFRPFAPSVLEERMTDWFDSDRPSPYMLLVADVHRDHLLELKGEDITVGLAKLKMKRSDIPAVTHVNNTARIQSVSRNDNPLYYQLIREFERVTGCPVIVNTSFNVRGEPIVCSPDEAYICFMRTEMDYLIMGSFLLIKNDQPEFIEGLSWEQSFAAD
ncbi:MAG: carbamoyltransferase [Fidelibacterota bacterium]